MTLMRYRPTNEANELLPRRFTDLLDEFFDDAFSPAAAQDNFIPKLDVSESDEQYHIDAYLPGMKKDDIHLDLENGRLSISGERQHKDEDKDRKYHRVETSYGSFTRTLQLPENIDAESVKAKFEDGILHITVNKQEDKVSKKIEIE